MKKEVVQAVLKRSKGLCEVCKRHGEEIHHIVYGIGKRKEHETIDSVVLLCQNCHRGTNGVHGKNGRELGLKLKRELQEKYFGMGYTEDKVRRMMGGKLY